MENNNNNICKQFDKLYEKLDSVKDDINKKLDSVKDDICEVKVKVHFSSCKIEFFEGKIVSIENNANEQLKCVWEHINKGTSDIQKLETKIQNSFLKIYICAASISFSGFVYLLKIIFFGK